jgi:hypothetical protein
MAKDDEFVPPEQLPNFRIRHFWAVIVVDPADNSEALVYWRAASGQPVPLLAADEHRLASIQKILPQVAKHYGRPLKLARFGTREDVEEIKP